MMKVYKTQLEELTPQIIDRLRDSIVILKNKRIMDISEDGKFQNVLSKSMFKSRRHFVGKNIIYTTIKPFTELTDMQLRAQNFFGCPAEFLKESDMQFYRTYHRGLFYGN